MNKSKLVDSIKEGHVALEALLSSMTEQQILQPGVYDELSVKDVLAHLAAWERMEVGWLEASLRGEKVVRYAPGFESTGDWGEVGEALNRQIFEENRDRPLPRVLEDLRLAEADLISVVTELTDDDLNDLHRFDWWDGEPIWTSIAGNSYQHIEEHMDLIEAWLGSGRG